MSSSCFIKKHYLNNIKKYIKINNIKNKITYRKKAYEDN